MLQPIGISTRDQSLPPCSNKTCLIHSALPRQPEAFMSTDGHDRILDVDDCPIFRESLALDLRAAGCEIVTAGTGEREGHPWITSRGGRHA
jgi:hypothetical protein